MYIEKNRVIGESYNPFTKKVDKVYSYESEKIFVNPSVARNGFASNTKAICSGNVIEFYDYERPVFYGYSSVSTGKKKISVGGKKRVNNVNATKRRIRRIINCNVSRISKFVTLTFAKNETDVKSCKNEFKKFIKRLNYRLVKDGKKKVKYLYVVEFQKRGAVHFHCVFFNLPFIKNYVLNDLWKNGFVRINKIDNCDNVGSYVVKYMNKELLDDRLTNCDLYGRSRGLKEPYEIKKPSEVAILKKAYKNCVIYTSSYNTEYNGLIEYSQVNLTRVIS